MIQKKKICNKCKKEKYIWKNHQGNKYCKFCWMSTLSLKKDIKQKRIKSFSDKKLKETREYSKLRKIYLNKNPMCEAAIKDCSLKASEIHHIKGRGKNYLLCDEWMAVCRNCHDYIHLHPQESRELGLLK